MMINFFNIATSIDGFIATKEGDISWLPQIDESNDYGFSEFNKNIDSVIMGKNTFEKVRSFGGDWPYENKVFVLSNSLSDIGEDLKDKVEVVSGDIKDIAKKIESQGFKGLHVDGGFTIHSFLKENLISEFTISRVPIILGSGIPLFGELLSDIKLEHLETKTYENGLVQSKYKVLR